MLFVFWVAYSPQLRPNLILYRVRSFEQLSLRPPAVPNTAEGGIFRYRL